MPIPFLYLCIARQRVFVLGVLAVAAAQGAGAQAPPPSRAEWFVHSDWLQASAISVGRSTAPSAAIAVERRTETVAADFGYLRAVRPMSTVHGLYAAISRRLPLGPATASAGAGFFAGQAAASADTSGYRYSLGGQTGYQSRFTYSSGLSIGVGVQFTLAFPLGSSSEVRASAAEWGFSGDPVKGDNARFLAGLGLSFQLPRTLIGGKSARGTN